jgi:hypothetical protein
MATSPSPRRRGRPETHGITALKAAARRLGPRAIDKRTSVGKAFARWRGDLVRDLGGEDTISTQQAAIVDLAARNKMLLDSIDAWLFVPHTRGTGRRSFPLARRGTALMKAPARAFTKAPARAFTKVDVAGSPRASSRSPISSRSRCTRGSARRSAKPHDVRRAASFIPSRASASRAATARATALLVSAHGDSSSGRSGPSC